MRKAGAKEVHFRVASPPVKSPCYYGMDFPSKEELLANKFVEHKEEDQTRELCEWLRAVSCRYTCIETANRADVDVLDHDHMQTSLAYLSVDGMMESVRRAKPDSNPDHFCKACFTSEYPIPIQEALDW